MKLKLNKIILFVMLGVSFVGYFSCKKSTDISPMENIIKQTPGTFEAEFNSNLWIGKSTSALIKDGKIVINTTHENGDKLSIQLKDNIIGKYYFKDTLNKAIFTEKISGIEYSTILLSTNISEIEITQIDTNFLQISGNLNLYLKSASGKIINFKNGIFYKVPYSYTSINLLPNMQGLIDGNPFEALAQANKDYILGSKYTFVMGVTKDSSTITLYIIGGDTVGNYQFPENGNAAFIKKGKYYSYGKGNVAITNIDVNNKLLSGKFNFFAINKNDNSDSIVVSQGAFTNVVFIK